MPQRLSLGRPAPRSTTLGYTITRAAFARKPCVAARAEQRLGGRGHTCLSALSAEYAPLSCPACRRNTMVKQWGPTSNPSLVLVPYVLLSVVIRVLVYHRHAEQLRGAYSADSALRHVCPRPPSRRSARAATHGLRANAARVIVYPYVVDRGAGRPRLI